MKVLVCEDEEALGNLYKELLESRGVKVVRGKTIKECQELCRAHSDIRAVLMDGNMPLEEGSGLTSTDVLVKDLLEHRSDLAGRILAFSALPGSRDRIIAVGAVGVRGRETDDLQGVLKPVYRPVIERLVFLVNH